mgnify:FL=1
MKTYKVLTYVWKYTTNTLFIVNPGVMYVLQVQDDSKNRFMMCLIRQEFFEDKFSFGENNRFFPCIYQRSSDDNIALDGCIYDFKNPERVHNGMAEYKEWINKFNDINDKVNLVI